MVREYLLACDFDQTLSFNDSGPALSELLGTAPDAARNARRPTEFSSTSSSMPPSEPPATWGQGNKTARHDRYLRGRPSASHGRAIPRT
jgi:hypothetical protein